MSDADSLKPDLGSLSPDEHPATAVGALADSPPIDPDNADGWQVVDFPDAMRVDDIPLAEGDIPVMAVTSYSGLVQQLQQENAQLRDRITHLEEALALSQLAARSEILHQGDTHAAAIAPHPEPSDGDPTQPAGQRHQILVETLNGQLHSSQDRIAQLERDQALMQQRLHEQVQQCLQAETTCRDLRTRLHRQQQQALQFKTALEKCLEMPAQGSAQATPSPMPETVAPMVSPDGGIPLFVPKTSPVQPWSQPSDGVTPEPSAQGDGERPKLSKFMGADQPLTPLTSSEAETLTERVDLDFVNRMFPNPPVDEAIASVTADAASIFDISPFLAAAPRPSAFPTEDTSGEAISGESLGGAVLDGAAWGSEAVGGDPLWDQLANLIQPAAGPDRARLENILAIAQQAEANPDLPSPADLPSRDTTPVAAGWPTPETAAPPLPALDTPESFSFDLKPRLATPADRQPDPIAAIRAAAELVAADSADPDSADPDSAIAASAIADSSEESPGAAPPLDPPLEPAMFGAAGPSPILYPLRPAKKITSLAAVELPTFPRR